MMGELGRASDARQVELVAPANPKKNKKNRWWEQILYEDWLVVSKIFYFHPYLAKIPIFIHIFQMGWFNHQLEDMLANSLRNIHRGFPMILLMVPRKPPGMYAGGHFEEPGYI